MILRSACISVVWCIGAITSFPTKVLNNIADNLDNFDGSFSGYDGPPPIDILSNSIGDDFFDQFDKVDYGAANKSTTTGAKQNGDTIIRVIDLLDSRDALDDNSTEPFQRTEMGNSTYTEFSLNSTTLLNNSDVSPNVPGSDISIFNESSSEEVDDASRSPRQQPNATDDDPEFKSKESQEESSEEEENMLTGLLSAFLGGLSTPEGGIDLDAILGLLGSLSTQNPDGTYDFQGLTDLLRGLFGGGESDVGAFAGGLIGAIIKGIAVPPGPKGAGKLVGKVFAGVLPALSGPPDPQDGEDMMDGWNKPQKPTIDLGGFLSGFFKTSASGSAGGDGE
nr:unnamed protein product [Callosobruchus analis]